MLQTLTSTKHSLITICVFLLFTATLAAQSNQANLFTNHPMTLGLEPDSDFSHIAMTRWMSPRDEKPMTYGEYMAQQGPSAPLVVTPVPGSTRGTASSGRILLVLVEANLYAPLQDELALYTEDLAREGFAVEIRTSAWGSPPEVRDYLFRNFYEIYGSAFAGVLLVGNLPVPWYDISGDQFPSDLYYMDLDGNFLDANGDGMFDGHQNGAGDTAPDIFLGRLHVKTITGNDVDLLEAYFDKIHAYRTGSMIVPEKALGFCDDDWAGWGKYGLNYGFEDLTVIDDIYETSGDGYEDKLDDGYHFIHTMVHSYAQGHHFANSVGDGWVFNSEVKAIDPWALFYNLFACSNCRYVEQDYMGGIYIFCETHGLAAVGCTKSGSMLAFEYFYDPLHRNACIGDAYRTWWEAVYPYNDGDRSWFYGMTLLGDPTLVARPGYYNDELTGAADFAQYPALTAASPQELEGFGHALALGDINDDGVEDLVVGMPGATVGGHAAAGRVEIAYGPDFLVRQEVQAVQPAPGEAFGYAVKVGDLNGDLKDDLAVGIPGRNLQDVVDAGAVRIFHGPGLAPGPVIEPTLHSTQTRFGSTLALGDFNMDQAADLASGGPGYNQQGMVEIFGGPLFTSLWVMESDQAKMGAFGAVLAAGDFNGDLCSDLVIGMPRAGTNEKGFFRVILGPKFNRTLEPSNYPQGTVARTGASLVLADFDHDGCDEIAVGVPGDMQAGMKSSGSVLIYQGIEDLTLWKILSAPQPERFAEFGTALAAADFDGDGFADLCVGSPFADDGTLRDAGLVHLFFGPDFGEVGTLRDSLPERGGEFGTVLEAGALLSGMPSLAMGSPRACIDPLGNPIPHAGEVHLQGFMLRADEESLPWQTGGQIHFSLDGGPDQAGNIYLNALSLSGTVPGTTMGPIHVPLNFDAITNLGFNLVNTPAFMNFGGYLDGEGEGSCTFSLPAAVPNGQGLRLYFAFFTLNPMNFASNPVMVDLE